MQLERMKILHEAMRKFVIMSGINAEDYDLLLNFPELLDSLELVYHAAYKEVDKIYNQPNVSEEIWNNYRLLGIDVKELVDLDQSLLKLKAHIRNLINEASKLNKNKKHS